MSRDFLRGPELLSLDFLDSSGSGPSPGQGKMAVDRKPKYRQGGAVSCSPHEPWALKGELETGLSMGQGPRDRKERKLGKKDGVGKTEGSTVNLVPPAALTGHYVSVPN